MRPWDARGRVRVDAAPPDGAAAAWDSDACAVVDAAWDVLSGGISRLR